MVGEGAYTILQNLISEGGEVGMKGVVRKILKTL